MESLLTIREVSEITQLTVGTLYHLISQRRIPVVRLSSRCVRFRKSDIEAWLSEKSVFPRSNDFKRHGER
jgi:excisionase family DNA binding protein